MARKIDRVKYNHQYHKKMEEIYKKDFNALKIYVNITRERLKVQKQERTYEIEPEVEKRLMDLNYIDWDEKSQDLYHPNYILTHKGNEQYLKLKSEYVKDYKFWIAIIALIISLLKNFGVI